MISDIIHFIIGVSGIEADGNTETVAGHSLISVKLVGLCEVFASMSPRASSCELNGRLTSNKRQLHTMCLQQPDLRRHSTPPMTAWPFPARMRSW